MPFSLALDSANGRLVVVDNALDAVMLVDIATGNRAILSDATAGTGDAFVAPKDSALDLANNRVFVLDSVLDAVVAVDLTTGNRTIYAQ